MTRPRFLNYRDRAEAVALGLVTVREIAQRFGVSTASAGRWAARRSFPAPVAELTDLSTKPARLWDWQQVRAYVTRIGGPESRATPVAAASFRFWGDLYGGVLR